MTIIKNVFKLLLLVQHISFWKFLLPIIKKKLEISVIH